MVKVRSAVTLWKAVAFAALVAVCVFLTMLSASNAYPQEIMDNNGTKLAAGYLITQGEPPGAFQELDRITKDDTTILLLEMGGKRYLVQFDQDIFWHRYLPANYTDETHWVANSALGRYAVEVRDLKIQVSDNKLNFFERLARIPLVIYVFPLMVLAFLLDYFKNRRKAGVNK